MRNTEGNEHICILDNLFNCRQPYQQIHLNERNDYRII